MEHGAAADHLCDGQSRTPKSPRRKPKPRVPIAIIATGRSDYPNQVNNVLGFPFIFRGALDVRATDDQRRDENRRRAKRSPNWRARTVPEEVAAAYGINQQVRAAITSSPPRSIRA